MESDSSDSSLSDVIPDISKFLKSPIPIQRTFQDNANTRTDTDRNPQVIYERVKTKDLANVNRKFHTQESKKDVNNKETDTGQTNGNSHREIQGYQPDVFDSLPQRKGGSSGKETQQNPDVIYQRSQDKELQFEQFENKQERESQSGTQEDTMDSNCFFHIKTIVNVENTIRSLFACTVESYEVSYLTTS